MSKNAGKKKQKSKKSTTNASKTSTKRSSSKKSKSKSKSKTSSTGKRYKKLNSSIKMPSSVENTTIKTENEKLSCRKPMMTTDNDQTQSVVKSSIDVAENSKQQSTTDLVSQPMLSSKLSSELEKGKSSIAGKLPRSKLNRTSNKNSPKSRTTSKITSSPTRPAIKMTKTAPKKSVISMVKSSGGVKPLASTAPAPATPLPPSITFANDDGSVFSSKVKNDDSALALVMHTAHDEAPIKRDETQIFVPGKGELRSTQPEPPET